MEIEVEENIKDMGQENVTKFDFNQINPRRNKIITCKKGKEMKYSQELVLVGVSGSMITEGNTYLS